MKKIIAIAAIAATVAASAMAVDFTGSVKAQGDLFNTADTTILSLDKMLNNGGDTAITAAVSADKAGASLRLGSGGTFDEGSIWIAPVDALKVTIGKVAVGSIAQDNFAWWAQNGKSEFGEGLKVECTFGSLGASAALNMAGGFYTKSNGLNGFTAEVNYNIDNIGKFQVVVAKDSQKIYGFGGWTAPANQNEWAFGIAYNKMPWEQTGFYGDVFFGLNPTDDTRANCIEANIGGQLALNGLMLRMTNFFDIQLGSTVAVNYGFMFKASYGIGAFTPYGKIEANGLVPGKAMDVIVGSEIAVGAAAIDVSAKFPISFSGYTFSVVVPFSVKVSL